MPQLPIYWTAAGRRAVLEWYERRLATFPVPVESRFVDTRIGRTHALIAGPGEGPAAVVLHGLDLNAAAMADVIAPLSERRRVVAIDLVGNPGRSAEARPRRSGPAYADWLAEALDGLGVRGPADLVGFSFGSWAAVKLATERPGRVRKLVSIGGGGFGWLRLGGQLTAAAGMVRHALRRDPASLDRAVRPIYGPGVEPDPPIAELLGLAFRHVRHDPTLAWLPPGRLEGLGAPTLVALGEHDLFFDPARTIARARRLPSLASAERLPGQGHMPSPSSLAELARRADAFFG